MELDQMDRTATMDHRPKWRPLANTVADTAVVRKRARQEYLEKLKRTVQSEKAEYENLKEGVAARREKVIAMENRLQKLKGDSMC